MTEKFIQFLENFSSETLKELESIYHEDISYVDPINKGQGIKHLRLIMQDLLKVFKNVKFELLEISENKQLAFVCWNMTYKFRGKNYLINGVSKLAFDDSGKIIKHEDYWDASFPLYGAFPLLGLLMKGIKRFVSVKPPK